MKTVEVIDQTGIFFEKAHSLPGVDLGGGCFELGSDYPYAVYRNRDCLACRSHDTLLPLAHSAFELFRDAQGNLLPVYSWFDADSRSGISILKGRCGQDEYSVQDLHASLDYHGNFISRFACITLGINKGGMEGIIQAILVDRFDHINSISRTVYCGRNRPQDLQQR